MAKRKRANGEGSITKRKDGRYMGQLSFKDPGTGKRKRKTIYAKSYDEARQKLDKMRYELQTGVFTAGNDITVEEWVLTWMKEYKRNTLKKGTYTTYLTNFKNHVFPYIGAIKIQDLKTHHVQGLYNRLLKEGRKGTTKSNKKGLSPITVKRIHVTIASCLKQALRNELVNKNVAITVELPKQNKHEIKPLTKDEIQALLDAAKEDRLCAAFILECGTGLRRGELLGLKWSDIDLDNRTLQVNRSLVRQYDIDAAEEGRTATSVEFETPKTEKSKRTISIPQNIIRELKAHRIKQNEEKLLIGKYYNNENLVFCNVDGSRINPATLTAKFKTILAKAGIEDARFHDLRHSVATILLEMNEHPKVVQELLGHSSITTTLDIYSHVSLDKKEEAAAKLNTIFK